MLFIEELRAFDPIPIVDLSELHSGLVPAELLTQDTAIRTTHQDGHLQEPLVDLRSYNIAGEKYYANSPYGKRIDGAIDGLYARRSVANKLVQANDILRKYNLELYVYDAYRSIECQNWLWDFFSDGYMREHPKASPKEVEEFARNYVSDPRRFDPDDPATHPLHSTGGAIDLTLRECSSGNFIDVGTFDDPSEKSHTHFYEMELKAGRVVEDDHRLLYRRVLYGAMLQAGFTNYPYEFWHYDYGNRMYACMLNRLGRFGSEQRFLFTYIPFDRDLLQAPPLPAP
jgi:D-alanyl-D-alanine dipeptidase